MNFPLFSYGYSMKKHSIPCLLLLLFPLLLAACGKSYDYSAHISELRSDIFIAETDEFSLTLSCISREYPYAADGVACPRADLVEISLVPTVKADDFSMFFKTETGEQGGEASFRNACGDWFFSESVSAFPQNTVSIRVSWGDETREVTATSVKNERTISYTDALNYALTAEKDRIGRMTSGGAFLGEFHVRLLRRDKNYYYIGIIDTDGETLSLLLDSESGSILARRDTRV